MDIIHANVNTGIVVKKIKRKTREGMGGGAMFTKLMKSILNNGCTPTKPGMTMHPMWHIYWIDPQINLLPQ